MFKRVLLLLWRQWLVWRGARLAASARVNPSVSAVPAALQLGEHARLYWGGEVLTHGAGRLNGFGNLATRVHEQLVAGVGEVQGHGRAHDAQADKSNIHLCSLQKSGGVQ